MFSSIRGAARPRVDIRMECCLQFSEHGNLLRQVHERGSQTTPSGNIVASDVKTPAETLREAGLVLGLGPDQGTPLTTDGPGVAEEFTGQGSGGFLVAGVPGDADVNAAVVWIAAEGDPDGLLEHSAQQGRAELDAFSQRHITRHDPSTAAYALSVAIKARYIRIYRNWYASTGMERLSASAPQPTHFTTSRSGIIILHERQNLPVPRRDPQKPT